MTDWAIALIAGVLLMIVGWGREPSAPGSACFTLGGLIVFICLWTVGAHFGWWPL